MKPFASTTNCSPAGAQQRLAFQLCLAFQLFLAVVAPPTLGAGHSQKLYGLGSSHSATLTASGTPIVAATPGADGKVVCGTTTDFGINSQQVFSAFGYASDVCCKLGETCGTALLPSTCRTDACAHAIATVADSCHQYLSDGIGAVAFGPMLSQAVAECAAERKEPVCNDALAPNFVAQGRSAAINKECSYDCAMFTKAYGLPAETTRCYIHDAVRLPSADTNGGTWPLPINVIWDAGVGDPAQKTFRVPTGEGITAVVIQGVADQAGRGSELGRRVDVDGKGVVAVLRHVSFSNLIAVAQITACLYESCFPGGALYGYQSTVIVEHSAFQGNSAPYGGGAIYMREGESLRVSDSTFAGNTADQPGGAVAVAYQKESQFTRCVFSSNTANRGGAIYVGTALPFRTFSMTTCSGTENTATDPSMSGCGAPFWFGAGGDCDDTALGLNPQPTAADGGSFTLRDGPTNTWSEISLTSVRLAESIRCQMSLPENVNIGTCTEQQASMSLTPVVIPNMDTDGSGAGTGTSNQGPFNDSSNAMWGVEITAVAIPDGGCALSCPAGFTAQPIHVTGMYGAANTAEVLSAVCSTTGQSSGEPTYLAQWHGECVLDAP